MSLAIKFGEIDDPKSLAGVVYFDAVTSYNRDLKGKVTEHPLEVGASVTDHFISSNPTYQISGVISHVDFSIIPSLIAIEGSGVTYKNKAPTSNVSVSDMAAGIKKLLPGVITQFIPKTPPQIIMDMSGRTNHRKSLESFFNTLMSSTFYNEKRGRLENRITLCTLFEMEGAQPTNPIGDLVVTSVSFKEDENTGDALFIDISLERVTFVSLKKVNAPKAAKKTKTARATKDPVDQGTENSTVEVEEDPTALGQWGNIGKGG